MEVGSGQESYIRHGILGDHGQYHVIFSSFVVSNQVLEVPSHYQCTLKFKITAFWGIQTIVKESV